MFKRLQDVEVVAHGNGDVLCANCRIRDPTQESKHIYCMKQERVLKDAKKQVTQVIGGSMKLSKMRLIGLKEDMASLGILLFNLQTSSQGLCLKQGRGEQLNNKYKYQMPKGLLQCKRAE